jgi:hypothetical protein
VTYDFFVFPADRAEDLESATEVYETAPERGVLTPGAPVAELLAAVRVACPDWEVTGHDGAAYVSTPWTDPMANLRTVADLARPLELSVLDVQLAALYDPRGAFDVALDTEGGPRLTWLTRPLLAMVMSHICDLRYHWLNISSEPGVYAQAYRDEDGSWSVEHREGSAERLSVARTTDAALVEEVLWSWARNDGRWQARLAFAPVEL